MSRLSMFPKRCGRNYHVRSRSNKGNEEPLKGREILESMRLKTQKRSDSSPKKTKKDE